MMIPLQALSFSCIDDRDIQQGVGSHKIVCQSFSRCFS